MIKDVGIKTGLRAVQEPVAEVSVSNHETDKANLGIGRLRDGFDELRPQLAVVEVEIKEVLKGIENERSEEDEMRTDVAETQDALSKLNQNARRSHSLWDGLWRRFSS